MDDRVESASRVANNYYVVMLDGGEVRGKRWFLYKEDAERFCKWCPLTCITYKVGDDQYPLKSG